MRVALVFALLLAASAGASAHAGRSHASESAASWTFDPQISLPLGLSIALYAMGLGRLWQRAGIGRGVRLSQAACFMTGWLLLVGALVAPLPALGERLFTAHMIEHELLMVVAAPLLVIARPGDAILWSFPLAWRRRFGGLRRPKIVRAAWRAATLPAAATVVHGAAIWVWHIPQLYGAALAHPAVHWLQHLCFLVTALLFWWALLYGAGRERSFGPAIFYLFATALHSGFLGILIAVARRPLYPAQTAAAAEWGLTPLEDQQLAGVIMWVPAGMVYAGAALALAALWIAWSGSQAARGHRDAVPTL
jgi:cytochrome c oxidase assembly factor CtaG